MNGSFIDLFNDHIRLLGFGIKNLDQRAFFKTKNIFDVMDLMRVVDNNGRF